MNPKPQREGEKKIEEILRNRILYIGNEIPEFFTKDKRDKQLYLGYPQQLIDELSKELSSLIREERKAMVKEIEKMKSSQNIPEARLANDILSMVIENLEKK